MNEIKDIFLGGTCNGSAWRDELIDLLIKSHCHYTWFNPVVDDWTPECQAEEDRQKANCKISVYCITPKMTGVFSIAEMVESSILNPDNTFITVRRYDGDATWAEGQMKSLKATRDLCVKHGAHYCVGLVALEQAINMHYKKHHM